MLSLNSFESAQNLPETISEASVTRVCALSLQKLELDRFMLYAHGPDLCRESDLRHAMANCFEALIGETLTREEKEGSAAFRLDLGLKNCGLTSPDWAVRLILKSFYHF